MNVILLPLLLLLSIVVAVSIRRAWRNRRTAEFFEEIARDQHGICFRGGILRHPYVQWGRQDHQVLLQTQSLPGRSIRITVLQAPWPDYRLNCEVFPVRFHPGEVRMTGVAEMIVGDVRFDADFRVCGNDTDTIV